MARPLELPYDSATRCADRYRWFQAIRPLGWPVFLDSGDPARSGERYDILAAGPRATLSGSAQPFAALRELIRILPEAAEAGEWPAAGAAIGYVGYEAGRPFAGLAREKPGTVAFMPEAAFAVYPWTLVIDHVARRAALTSLSDFSDAEARSLRERLLGAAEPVLAPFAAHGAIRSNLERAQYLPRARRILDYIDAGDCYQVNLTREFRVAFSGDPWTFHRHLHDVNPAPMGGYLEYPFGSILSSSPERFVTLQGREAVTRPIKGTRRRRADAAADEAARRELLASEKDRAENVMIVDLLRNDFGRVCETGSVCVTGLCELESFATVHHLVSTVRGTLARDHGAIDLLEACFPGGSITGAPKRRAMQIIDELEPHRREVYCGAIGYVAPSGRMDLNIPIRTTLCVANELRFHAGGGIVADSTPEEEFEETEAKVAAIRRAIATFAAAGQGREAA